MNSHLSKFDDSIHHTSRNVISFLSISDTVGDPLRKAIGSDDLHMWSGDYEAFSSDETLINSTRCMVISVNTSTLDLIIDSLGRYADLFPFIFICEEDTDACGAKQLHSFFHEVLGTNELNPDLFNRRLNQLLSNWDCISRNHHRASLFLNAIMKEAADHVYFKDLKSRFLLISRSQIKRYGKKEEDIYGKTDFDIFTDHHAGSAFEDEQTIIKTGKGIRKTERETWEDREDSWVSTMKAPLKNRDGEIIGTFGISRDITERVRTQQELMKTTQKLKQSQQSLLRSNQELEEFAYVVSHDLQEPLRKISAFGDRLKTRIKDRLDEKESDYLDRMMGSSQRMSGLINDLLKYSRLSTKAREFECVDLNEVIADVLDDLSYAIEQTEAKIELSTLPCIWGDSRQMHQLFQNIIGNSLKFRNEGIAPIVQIGEVAKTDAIASIRISDNGIGFEPQFAGKIFKVFQRLHSQKEYKGSGIGLSICKKIVERHGGEIRASSELGNGAVFVMKLPLNTDQESSKEPEQN